MKALLVNCTLKASPERFDTPALAEVLVEELRKEEVEGEEGHEWSQATGRAAASNFLAAAKALRDRPIPAPPG